MLNFVMKKVTVTTVKITDLLSAGAVGERLGVSRSGVYKQIMAGQIPVVEMTDGRIYIRQQDIPARKSKKAAS